MTTSYALLIYRTEHGDAPDPSGTGLKKHIALQEETSARNELRYVARLNGLDTAKTVVWKGGSHDVTDGPYAETKEWLVGFYVVDCVDEETALARARSICPVGHAIEVRPIGWLRGV